jgi:hypothetical protein
MSAHDEVIEEILKEVPAHEQPAYMRGYMAGMDRAIEIYKEVGE